MKFAFFESLLPEITLTVFYSKCATKFSQHTLKVVTSWSLIFIEEHLLMVKLTASVLNASDDFGAKPNFLGALAAASTILSKAVKSTAPI